MTGLQPRHTDTLSALVSMRGSLNSQFEWTWLKHIRHQDLSRVSHSSEYTLFCSTPSTFALTRWIHSHYLRRRIRSMHPLRTGAQYPMIEASAERTLVLFIPPRPGPI